MTPEFKFACAALIWVGVLCVVLSLWGPPETEVGSGLRTLGYLLTGLGALALTTGFIKEMRR